MSNTPFSRLSPETEKNCRREAYRRVNQSPERLHLPETPRSEHPPPLDHYEECRGARMLSFLLLVMLCLFAACCVYLCF